MSGCSDGEACQAVSAQEDAEREARGRAIVDDVPRGLTFVEIFAVAIHSPCDLYGTITINDGLSSEVLFRRDRSNSQHVGPGGLAELTGPARAAWCDGEVVMSIDLMAADNDDEIGSGQVVWNTYDTTEIVYDKVEEYELEGVSGGVTVRCAAITNAVVATVVVELTSSGNKESSTDIYGTLSAATSMFGSDKITLFNRELKDAASVQAGESIPLLRNVIVVPLDSSLEIMADLWTGASAPGGQIVKAEAEFEASTTGTAKMAIRGPNGEVTVQVNWSRN